MSIWQRWVEWAHKRRRNRTAFHAELWLEAVHLLLEACRAALQPQAMPPDLVPVLQRIDWRLEHILHSNRSLRRALRERAPTLSARIAEATDQAFRLRNQMTSYFIRWKAFQDASEAAVPTAFLDRREMEEHLLAASRMARDLTSLLEEIRPVLLETVLPATARQ